MSVNYKQAIAEYAINKPCTLFFKYSYYHLFYFNRNNVVVKSVTLLLCVWEVPGSIMPLKPLILTHTFHGIFQSLQANTGTVLQTSHDHILPIYSNSLFIHYFNI
jgi:hypothetical protein